MLKKRRKDRNRRKLVEENWKQRREWKVQINDIRISKEKREEAEKMLVLKDGERDKSKTRVQNRCVETGNARSVVRWYRRSGLKVRERAREGKLPGVYKVSW